MSKKTASVHEAPIVKGSRLPQELEREIFELAAYYDPPFVPTLILVARRVKEWIKKFLCRVLMLCGSSHLFDRSSSKRNYPFPDNEDFSRFKAIPPSILQNFVHHLYLDRIYEPFARSFLSKCTAIHDLWILIAEETFSDPSIVEMAGHLHLRRLHCYPDQLFSRDTPIDFTLPIFSRLTHLELLAPHTDNASKWDGIATIFHLTHFAFNSVLDLPLAVTVLQQTQSLRVVIFISPDNESYVLDGEQEGDLLKQDARFVQMARAAFSHDWREGALGGSDSWLRAEAHITWRQSERGDRSQYIVEDNESVPVQVDDDEDEW